MQLDYRELLNTSTDLAFALLESGAEIYRVEESIHRIFDAYGVQHGAVFAIPTLLIVTVQDETGRPQTEMRRLGGHGSDLDKVAAYNALCRRICEERPDFALVHKELARIRREPVYTLLQQTFACGMVSFGFTLLFGGGIADALCALACGLLLKPLLYLFARFETNSFFTTICASAYVAVFCFLAVGLQLGQNLDKISIGVLMNLVPGVALTNVMRDIIAGDLVAGLTKLVEALLTATGIALGTGTALTVCRALMGGLH